MNQSGAGAGSEEGHGCSSKEEKKCDLGLAVSVQRTSEVKGPWKQNNNKDQTKPPPTVTKTSPQEVHREHKNFPVMATRRESLWRGWPVLP